uniref:Uncharacterized protein n=1 Tax=Parascaris equorum TaxID=6256 RepID=A0A914S6P8_PAREQ
MARIELPSCLVRNGLRNKQYSEIVYNAIQCMCFAIMAAMIMRLKLFFTPHLCIMAAILANTKFISAAIGRNISTGIHRFLLVALVAMMAVKGIENIQKQRAIQGEYSNPEQEMLFEWIVKNTKLGCDVEVGQFMILESVKEYAVLITLIRYAGGAEIWP